MCVPVSSIVTRQERATRGGCSTRSGDASVEGLAFCMSFPRLNASIIIRAKKSIPAPAMVGREYLFLKKEVGYL